MMDYTKPFTDAAGAEVSRILNPENPFIPDLKDLKPAQLQEIAMRMASDGPVEAIAYLLETVQALQAKEVSWENDAYKDGLTGVYNRRAFGMMLDHEMKQASRGRGQAGLSLLYADLSLFKSVNDNYGHRAGDIALQSVAEVIQNSCRRGDVVARVGGDEFAVILPNCNRNSAKDVRARISGNVDKLRFDYEGHSLRVGINIGLAEYEPGQSVEEFVHKADRVMQRVKIMDPSRKGRTRDDAGRAAIMAP